MEFPTPINLPADLPEDWVWEQIIAPNGSDTGKPIQYGYNYLMAQVNAAQRACNILYNIQKETFDALWMSHHFDTAAITIPAKGWKRQTDAADRYGWCIAVACDCSTAKHCPNVVIHTTSLANALNAGLCPTVEARDNYLQFFAQKPPDADIAATVALFADTSLLDGSTYLQNVVIPATGWRSSDGEDGYDFFVDVACKAATAEHYPSVSVDGMSLGAAKKAGLCPTIHTLDGYLRFWAKEAPAENMVATVTLLADSNDTSIQSIVIPAAGWTEQADNQYKLCIDVACEGVTAEHYPDVAIHRESLAAAKNTGLSPTVQPLDGFLRFWARKRPTADLAATVVLVGSFGQSGGSSSAPDTSGYTIATNAEVSNAINSIFG